jgi:hypothetical protein
MRATGTKLGGRRRWRRALLACGVTIVALPAGAAESAGATVTFGADLSPNRPADLLFHCNLPPPFFGPYRPPNAYFPGTCTAFTAGNFGGGGTGSHLVPNGSWVVTKIRVKEPPTGYDSAWNSQLGPFAPLGQSGPLKISVLEALRSPAGGTAVCCTVPRESGQFTPNMGPSGEAITEVTLNPPLPVHAITTVTGVYEFDAITVSAAQTDSVIPAGRSDFASSGGYYPAVRPGQERHEGQTSFGSGDTVNKGTQIMLQADLEPVAGPPPAPGSGGGGVPGGGGGTAQPITLGRQTAVVKGGDAVLDVRCNRTTARCLGVLNLQSQATPRAKAQVNAVTTYGTGYINIPAGRSGKVKVHLSAAGRKLVRKHKRATVVANVTVGGMRVASVSIQLKR